MPLEMALPIVLTMPFKGSIFKTSCQGVDGTAKVWMVRPRCGWYGQGVDGWYPNIDGDGWKIV